MVVLGGLVTGMGLLLLLFGQYTIAEGRKIDKQTDARKFPSIATVAGVICDIKEIYEIGENWVKEANKLKEIVGEITSPGTEIIQEFSSVIENVGNDLLQVGKNSTRKKGGTNQAEGSSKRRSKDDIHSQKEEINLIFNKYGSRLAKATQLLKDIGNDLRNVTAQSISDISREISRSFDRLVSIQCVDGDKALIKKEKDEDTSVNDAWWSILLDPILIIASILG